MCFEKLIIVTYKKIHDTKNYPKFYFSCAPNCSNCTNGKCISPKECRCNPDFLWDNSTQNCEPTCSKNCTNGKCIGPNKCACDEGYAHFEDAGTPCRPICLTPCKNGACIAPNKCSCSTGLKFANGSSTECESFCKPACVNGFCLPNGKCMCHPGFTFQNSSTTICAHSKNIKPKLSNCQPPCINGKCVDNNCIPFAKFTPGVNCTEENCVDRICSEANKNCVCPKGYSELNSLDCIPNCLRDCVNAVCIAPDVCECNEGYAASLDDSNICVPVCGERNIGCSNGRCISTNKCECFEGYELDEMDPFKCGRCINGNCNQMQMA